MDAALSSEDTKLSCLGELGESGRELALRRMAIRQARLERLALSAPTTREWSTVGRWRVGKSGLIFPQESPGSVT